MSKPKSHLLADTWVTSAHNYSWVVTQLDQCLPLEAALLSIEVYERLISIAGKSCADSFVTHLAGVNYLRSQP